MTLSLLTLALIIIVSAALGWLARSYLVRTQADKVAKFDAAAKAFGTDAESAYNKARAQIGAKVDDLRKP